MASQRQLEQQRVDQVIVEIKQQLKQAKKEYEKAHAETSSVEKNYLQNAKVNTTEVDDRMETNAEIQQQKQLVAKNIQTEQILKEQLETLKDLKKSPYFGRIDIQDPDETSPESLYIGTASLSDEHQNFLVYDWRAPISSVYYNGTLGQVEYETPAGRQETELLKKRQFKITDGQIQNMFDTSETVGDELLQSVLDEHSDEYMKNIVATIQKDQNDIIRDTNSDLLLVQGVAGSGKTSAILQRIAFLLYHSRASLNADQIVLFSPNLLFSRYISDVLPSLGEKNMRQVTLHEFFSRRLQGLKVESLFNHYEKQWQLTEAEKELNEEKKTAEFMAAIKDYADHLTASDLCFTDISLHGKILFSQAEIRQLYADQPVQMTPGHKFAAVKNQLIKKLNKLVKRKARSTQIQDQLEDMSSEQYLTLLGDKTKESFHSYDEERDYLGHQLASQQYEVIYDALYNDFFFDSYEQYGKFLQNKLPESAAGYSLALEYHQIALADCAPLLYLRDLVTAGGKNHRIAHLFIDEMQDYTLAQLIYLKHVFGAAQLTLLGDSEQALYASAQRPQALLENIAQTLDARKANLKLLNRSYRSTKQITDFMKAMLPEGENIQAFNRPGNRPLVCQVSTDQAALKALTKHLNASAAKYSTVALITKTMAESRQLYDQLRRDLPVNLLTEQDRSLPQGIAILPIYLAKGLEFDSVIVNNVSQAEYSSSEERGILYTICSRAMHELTLISQGGVTPLIKQIDPELYTLEQTLPVK
ncbi:ATP-dependent DNA helicase [Ligilactobacillus salitolerans]|uniref:ATP-dependent DNA helicase n=1 Tax=Ligilactobacillus salitolerans TaxID=1808352 RepID=A0A401IWD5_9LACO|nr:RNA polymerase recycling motor HelD [Ligilactobacillus salitolerans]GBG95860.1 ATP-dependent DNA helicase [Ligilactobacillus salitolerans]